jgi:hypothetical protein
VTLVLAQLKKQGYSSCKSRWCLCKASEPSGIHYWSVNIGNSFRNRVWYGPTGLAEIPFEEPPPADIVSW